MNARKCDRCENFYTCNYGKNFVGDTPSRLEIQSDINKLKCFDLSDDCMNELFKFFKNERDYDEQSRVE